MGIGDYMLVCGCFEVPIFVYEVPHRSPSRTCKSTGTINAAMTVSKNENTTIFVPVKNGVESVRMDGIMLPFGLDSLCIVFSGNHFQWLKVKEMDKHEWSTWDYSNKIQGNAAAGARVSFLCLNSWDLT